MTSVFGESREGGAHKGVDFGGKTPGAADGKNIPALVGGTVKNVFVDNATAGHGVVITGEDGREYRYIHMKYAPKFKVGQKVEAGVNLGQVGNTGQSYGSHLDLKIVENGKNIDPLAFIKSLASGGGGGSTVSGTSASTPSGMGTNTARRGDKGPTVEAIQKAVGTMADGVFGKNTENAVKAFQKKNGLTADGVVGPDTWAAINKTSAGKNATGSKSASAPKVATGSSYTNTYKTKNEALKAPGYQGYKKHLTQAIATGKVPTNWVVALTELIGRESTWSSKADNPGSSAQGYGQFINDTVKDYEKKTGLDYSNPVHQIIMTAQYVKDRYKTPEKALEHWDKYHWY